MSSVCCNFCKSSRSRLHLCNSTDERNLCFGKHKNIISLQCSWVKKVYDDSFHKWKIMSLHLVNKSFGKSYFPFQTFFQLRVSEVIPLVLLGAPCGILSQPFCYSKYIQIVKNDAYFIRPLGKKTN